MDEQPWERIFDLDTCGGSACARAVDMAPTDKVLDRDDSGYFWRVMAGKGRAVVPLCIDAPALDLTLSKALYALARADGAAWVVSEDRLESLAAHYDLIVSRPGVTIKHKAHLTWYATEAGSVLLFPNDYRGRLMYDPDSKTYGLVMSGAVHAVVVVPPGYSPKMVSVIRIPSDPR